MTERLRRTTKPSAPKAGKWVQVTSDFAYQQSAAYRRIHAEPVDTYLQVVTSQATALTDERNDIGLMRWRLEANVPQIKAIGGGRDISSLPRH